MEWLFSTEEPFFYAIPVQVGNRPMDQLCLTDMSALSLYWV